MLPNVYLSSSLKEEFGISIIEAMTAGFLIIAPRSGGVSSYIQNAENGFLIDTYTADEMKRGIESIFFLSEFTPGNTMEIFLIIHRTDDALYRSGNGRREINSNGFSQTGRRGE
jgi:glycosyltransferase involved in cell wall biosynthesis